MNPILHAHSHTCIPYTDMETPSHNFSILFIQWTKHLCKLIPYIVMKKRFNHVYTPKNTPDVH